MAGLSLRTKVAMAFLVIAALVAAAVGALAYQSASLLIRADAEQRFADVVDQAADNLRAGRGIALWFEDTPPPATSENFDVLSQEELSVQVLHPDGRVLTRPDSPRAVLPPTAAELELARSADAGAVELREVDHAGERFRTATLALGGGNGALQLAQAISPTEQLLRSLRTQMLVVGGAIALVAGAVGWFVGWRLTRRLARLTAAAEHISATGKLEPMAPGDIGSGSDEVGRLAGAFTAMLARLAGARQDQRRLVEDAAHELRTPLTSVRTNVSMLRHLDRMPAAERDQLLADLQGETRELADLVGEVVRLATDQHATEESQDVDLGALAERAAARTRRRYDHEISVRTVPEGSRPVVTARPHALERALTNIVENAAKLAPMSAGPIEIEVQGTRVAVADRGPGIADADRNRIFDRFYRAEVSRALPGSGLGLAIVREIVEQHGGTVFARHRPGGGAVIGFDLPTQS
ncbi:HAMP domain-containing sensor histidine kinase [Lipingzhangella sp. LS1_29]|uniref:histidine kinase n=1 Tax=Lipingzhangella rawalii TaxID=2055835 RepID=A0ABU2H3K4_9ACTN|nr:HAMP domain-containing sensor histidine kinase [Lipingzhangella rawalii]MDS1269881.1 HAMP domain-containing sensor histidine kinase [Lipingzhangella rawalii]